MKISRALLHQIELDGPEGKRGVSQKTFLQPHLDLLFVQMVDPEHGAPLHAKY